MSSNLMPVQALERLKAREGVDTRPILVRVLTDLFVQKPEHTAEDVANYEELVGKLLDVVDVDSRAAVSRKLSTDPRAPRSLIERLIADDVVVSAPILARFPDVPRETLLAIALDGGPVEAAAVASRPDIDDELVRTLAHHHDELALETLVANPAANLSDGSAQALVERATTAPALASALLRRADIDPAILAPLYQFAEPAQRAQIRAGLAARSAKLSSAARAVRNGDQVAAILSNPFASSSALAIAEALADALALKPEEAARLATEPSGEPFVMMLRAAGVSDELIVRGMLISQPEIAQSVPRFFELVEIAETTPRAVAAELVFAMVGRSPSRTGARHEAFVEPLVTPERPGSARQAAGRRASDRQDLARRRG